MKVELTAELTSDQLGKLAKLAGKSFLSSDDIENELRAVIARALNPGVDIGYLYRVTYYREDPDEDHGFKLYTHTFLGQRWPHVKGRPRMTWDGMSIKTGRGAFTVDADRGFIDHKPPAAAEKKKNARTRRSA